MVIEPLLVTVKHDEDGYCMASDDHFVVYGDGPTPYYALQDYIVSLIDYYQLLSTRAEGDPPTEALFHHLRSYFRTIG